MKQKIEIIIKTCHIMITEYKSELKILDAVWTFWLSMFLNIILFGRVQSLLESLNNLPRKTFLIF